MQKIFLRLLFGIILLLPFFFPQVSQLTNSWWGFLPLAVFFAIFVLSLLSWGNVIAKSFNPLWENNAAYTYLFSSAVAVLLVIVLGHLGFLGESFRVIYYAFLIWGIFLDRKEPIMNSLKFFENNWLNAIFFFIFFLRFFSAYLPQGHGDPLLYHLEAPRLWNLQGVVKLNRDLPVPLLAAAWEYFYLWPQVMFASVKAQVSDLVMAQIFSQWIHLFWGLFGGLVIIKELFAHNQKKDFHQKWLAAALLAVLFVSSMQWTGALAKNDCGVAFWCLGAWLFWRDLNLKNFFLGGLFAGLAISGKISAILFIIPLIPILIVSHFINRGKDSALLFLKKISIGVIASFIGFLLGAGPVYLRNWIETRNPFYTMFSKYFPSEWVSQSWATHFEAHQLSLGENHWLMLLRRIKTMAHEGVAFWFWILLIPLLLNKKTRKELVIHWEWISLFLLSVLLCVFAVGPNAEQRYLGASLWIGAFSGIYFFYGASRLFAQKLRGKYESSIIVLLIVVLLATSKLPTHFLWKFFKIQPGYASVLQHTAGKAKEWARNNVKENELLVLNGDNETYYLSTIRTTVLTERPDIDRATIQKTDVKDFLLGLCQSSGASFLLDVREGASLRKRFPHDGWEKALVFSQDGSSVYDLIKLQKNILNRNAGCGENKLY